MTEAQFKPGDACGPYIAGKFLNDGGICEVYEAMHGVTGQPVALKCLKRRHHANHDLAERMFNEAKVVAGIDHPNVVCILDAGNHGKTVWIAMELLEGLSLRDLLRLEGPLGVSDALHIGYEIASGLAAAHDQRIIHRDLKPENIFITSKNKGHEVKLLDFGAAKFYAHDIHSTNRLSPVGTPHYMSPEQLRNRKVDGRSDLYAFGAVLYEMLAGRYIFSDEGGAMPPVLQVGELHFHAEPVSLRSIRPDVPEQVRALIERMVAKDPDARPPSAAVVASELFTAKRRYEAEREVRLLSSPRPDQTRGRAEAVILRAPAPSRGPCGTERLSTEQLSALRDAAHRPPLPFAQHAASAQHDTGTIELPRPKELEGARPAAAKVEWRPAFATALETVRIPRKDAASVQSPPPPPVSVTMQPAAAAPTEWEPSQLRVLRMLSAGLAVSVCAWVVLAGVWLQGRNGADLPAAPVVAQGTEPSRPVQHPPPPPAMSSGVPSASTAVLGEGSLPPSSPAPAAVPVAAPVASHSGAAPSTSRVPSPQSSSRGATLIPSGQSAPKPAASAQRRSVFGLPLERTERQNQADKPVDPWRRSGR